MAIDIGAAATDRGSWTSATYTYVTRHNPANGAGTIDTIEVFANTNMGGIEAGTFYVVSGSNLSTRDYESIGSVTAGSKQTFTGLSIDVETDDYLGYYNTGGYLEKDSSGADGGFLYKSGDYIPCSNVSFTDAPTAYHLFSIYGTGTESGGGATEKTGSDTGAGADARASGNPVAALSGGESGGGADSLPARDIALPDSGAGVDALVSLQTPSAKTASDAGSGVEAVPVYSAILAGSESGSGVEAFIARLLAAAEVGYGAESSEIGGGGLLKNLFASELGEGADGLIAKIEMPTKGGGMRLWT